MARKGDLGPYAPGNVYCATFRQNAKDVDPARIGEALRAKRRLPRHEWLEWRARRRAA
jgi:hypothetical protein